MSDSKQEQDAAANWRALQAELGIVAEGPEPRTKEPPRAAAPAPKREEPELPASMWGAESPKGGEPLPNESPFIEGSLPVHGEGSATTEPPGADEPEAATPSGDHEVEVGEAPEEIPETEEEKRPRRRRGRRRRRSEGGPREDAPEEREMPDESAADADQGEEDAGEEDDEEEVEIVPFADWNVPSWQELIDSLYRPER